MGKFIELIKKKGQSREETEALDQCLMMPEILEVIFSHLKGENIMNVALVCR